MPVLGSDDFYASMCRLIGFCYQVCVRDVLEVRMGTYALQCPVCHADMVWFSGNKDQRCLKCVTEGKPVTKVTIKDTNIQNGEGSIEIAWSGRKLLFASDGNIFLNGRLLGTDSEVLKGVKRFFTEVKD